MRIRREKMSGSSLMIMSVFGLKNIYGKDPIYIVFRTGSHEILNAFLSFDEAQNFCNLHLDKSPTKIFPKVVSTKSKFIPKKLSIKSIIAIEYTGKWIYLSKVEIKFIDNKIEDIGIVSHSNIDEKNLLLLKNYLPLRIERDILSKSIEKPNIIKKLSV